MGNAGTTGGAFRRAIQQRHLRAAADAARELGWLSLEDAWALLLLIAEQDDPRYPRAAARWLSRLLGERDLELGEAAMAAAALVALPGRSNRAAVVTLEELMWRPRPGPAAAGRRSSQRSGHAGGGPRVCDPSPAS